MKTQEAINYFTPPGKKPSISRLARALGITPQSAAGWGEYPPEGQQYKIEVLTQHKLTAEGSPYRNRATPGELEDGA